MNITSEGIGYSQGPRLFLRVPRIPKGVAIPVEGGVIPKGSCYTSTYIAGVRALFPEGDMRYFVSIKYISQGTDYIFCRYPGGATSQCDIIQR